MLLGSFQLCCQYDNSALRLFIHRRRDDFAIHTHKHFRLPELLGKPLGKPVRQVGEIRFAESDDKEISRDDVIDITIRIAQCAVERQTIQLAVLVADQCYLFLVGIHGLDISADYCLHTLQIIADLRFIRSLSRLHH